MDPKVVVSVALGWVGQDFRPNEREQCANFVRHVFAKCGYDLPSTTKPSDLDIWPGMDLGPAYANSLAGDEIGPKIPRNKVRAGDLLLFRRTYKGEFPDGVYTHVGIAVNNTEMVDRSTSAHPVTRRSIDGTFPGMFAEARRPKRFITTPAPAPKPPVGEWLKVYRKPSNFEAYHYDLPKPRGELTIKWEPGKLAVKLDGVALHTKTMHFELLHDGHKPTDG